MTPHLNGSKAIAVGPAPTVRLVKLEVDRPAVVRFLGEVSGMDTHWLGKCSAHCPGQDMCPTAVHRLKMVWKGYAPVLQLNAGSGLWNAMVIEVTENLWNEFLRDRLLRGEEWEVVRKREKKTRFPVYGTFCQALNPDLLPRPHSILSALRHVYGVQDFRLDIPCLLQPKLRVEPVAGPPRASLAAPEPAPAFSRFRSMAEAAASLHTLKGE